MRLEYMKDRMCLYRPFLRPAAEEALNSAVFGENFVGSTDPSAFSLLVMFCAITQPMRMLELGTFHGFGTLTIAEILATNKRPGTLVTVEPIPKYQERAKEFVFQAGLASTVQFVRGFSTDEEVLSIVEEQAPFDITYIDSSHQFATTLEELDLYLIERPLIRPGGLVFLHDITLELEDDPGVGPAVDKWIKRHPDYHYLPLSTKRIWPQPAGFGIIQTPIRHSLHDKAEGIPFSGRILKILAKLPQNISYETNVCMKNSCSHKKLLSIKNSKSYERGICFDRWGYFKRGRRQDIPVWDGD